MRKWWERGDREQRDRGETAEREEREQNTYIKYDTFVDQYVSYLMALIINPTIYNTRLYTTFLLDTCDRERAVASSGGGREGDQAGRG